MTRCKKNYLLRECTQAFKAFKSNLTMFLKQLSNLLCAFFHSGDDEITQINAINY